MARKKSPNLYTPEQMDALAETLKGHDLALTQRIKALADSATFNDACSMREAAQAVVSIRMILHDGHGTLATARKLAELSGEPQQVPGIDDCLAEIEEASA